MRELLERDYQDGVRDRLSASDLGGSSREKHAQLSRTATALAQGEVPNDLLTALRSSDLSRIVRPVIDKLTDIRGEYLSKRIPPHVGHGVRRTLAFEKPEVIQAEMDWEATQDRGSAASLIEHMVNFVESGTRDSFVTLMRRYKCCGDWTFWLTTPPKEDAAHPEAEQVVANTLVMLYRLHQFTREYEEQYMKAQPLRFARWHWFEPSDTTHRIEPLAYPLIASALEIFTRDDFKHL